MRLLVRTYVILYVTMKSVPEAAGDSFCDVELEKQRNIQARSPQERHCKSPYYPKHQSANMARGYRLQLVLCAMAYLSSGPRCQAFLQGQPMSLSLNFTAPSRRASYGTTSLGRAFFGSGFPQMLNWGSLFNVPFISPATAPRGADATPPSSRKGAGPTCPPPGYSPLYPFDLESCISGKPLDVNRGR